MKIGDKINCEVTGIQEYGVFVKCDEYSGLIHISEISEQFVESTFDIFKAGEMIDVVVLEVDEARKQLKLSYKKAHPIHEEVARQIKIQKGFHSLAQKIDEWIDEYEVDVDDKNWFKIFW